MPGLRPEQTQGAPAPRRREGLPAASSPAVGDRLGVPLIGTCPHPPCSRAWGGPAASAFPPSRPWGSVPRPARPGRPRGAGGEASASTDRVACPRASGLGGEGAARPRDRNRYSLAPAAAPAERECECVRAPGRRPSGCPRPAPTRGSPGACAAAAAGPGPCAPCAGRRSGPRGGAAKCKGFSAPRAASPGARGARGPEGERERNADDPVPPRTPSSPRTPPPRRPPPSHSPPSLRPVSPAPRPALFRDPERADPLQTEQE